MHWDFNYEPGLTGTSNTNTKKKGKKEKQQEQQVDTGMQKSQQAAADAVSNLRGHAEG